MAIIGTDDRITIPNDLLTERPFSAIVQITVGFPDGFVAGGSGALIGPDDVLTAAHVVYSAEHGGWATETYVTPAGGPGQNTFGTYTAENIYSVAGWVEDQSFDWDYAYIDLDQNIGFQTGWFDIQNGAYTGSIVESLGYPGDHGFNQMVYTNGTIDYTGYNVFKFIDDLDLMPGQSGSPLIYTSPYTGEIDVTGIVSHHQYFPSTINGALKLTDSMVTQINGWADNSINNPTTAPPAFNESWYLFKYPDIANAVNAGVIESGQTHFSNFGWREGRDPNSTFNTGFYLAMNTDIAAAEINPFDHYLSYGQYEGRILGIDATDYLTRYPDVAMSYVGPASMHYALCGRFEGRTAKPAAVTTGYNESDYLISSAQTTSAEIELVGIPQNIDTVNFVV
ncbi:MAG: trypsin-like peptidase domain-containing protein [Proteobacteria bacterium]|nr:trypsin-like serine protease [Desulfobacula sp.]MBU4131535.1 trypsin-like peptidase domain-containing protein [Pseudomonadota bacterium]